MQIQHIIINSVLIIAIIKVLNILIHILSIILYIDCDTKETDIFQKSHYN